jgi:pilus assembly protein Flp/PilA
MLTVFNRLWKDESGQGMVEYGLIIALVAVAVITVLGTMGGTIKDFFQKAVDGLKGTPAEPTL